MYEYLCQENNRDVKHMFGGAEELAGLGRRDGRRETRWVSQRPNSRVETLFAGRRPAPHESQTGPTWVFKTIENSPTLRRQAPLSGRLIPLRRIA